MISAAIESGAGVPFDALMNDGDVLEITAEYLEWRAEQMSGRQ